MGQEKKDDDKLHKVETVPPPAGESDAYNAPTRVGPVTSEAWAELIKQANEEGKAAAAKSASGSPAPPNGPVPDKSPASSARPAVPRPAAPAEPPPADTSALPRAYDVEDDDEAATLLHPKARSTDAPAGAPEPAAASHAPASPSPSGGPSAPSMAPALPPAQPRPTPAAPTLGTSLAWALVVLFLSIAFVGFAVWASLTP